MDTITVTNHADIEFIVLINQKFWDGLPDEQKAIITDAADKADELVRNAMTDIEAGAYAAAKENGMAVYTPTEEELAQWKEAAAPVLENYKANTGELGTALAKAAAEM